MLNITKLAVLMAIFGGGQVYQRLSNQHVWVAVLAIVLTGLATLMAAIGLGAKWSVVSPATLAIFAVYIVGSWLLFKQSAGAQEPETIASERSLRWGWTVFVICAASIIAAAPFLAFSADEIADITGISQSFIGVLAVAFVTSLRRSAPPLPPPCG